jgi:uncharacterized alkaline shock family protein YloU
MITPGKTTIALDVLLTIARLTTLGVPGVSRMGKVPAGGVKGILRRRHQDEGLEIEVEDDTVYASIFVVLDRDVNVREVCGNIQQAVARAIQDIVGMQVGWINVHVEDIDFSVESESAAV